MSDTDRLTATDAFARLGRINLGETDLEGVLETVARLAVRTVPGAGEVSVTLIRDARARTAAFTGEVARHLDESQYARGHGPCLDAAASLATLTTRDTTTDTRWPHWAARAAEAGVRSALAVGLPVAESVTGALNVYARVPDAFSPDAVGLAQTFAGYAAVALANAHVLDRQTTLAHQMQAAMASRAVIEQAKGIIMGDRRCTADEAFRMLAEVSRAENRKVRDVAAALVARAAGAVAG
ncbi:GAF and ANTAR domain-containing protein [Amorphoplanes nipponensis]|uniref:Transcriptional regulator n=1 Tax=Actinoplanes nipponensis TaxID=135950 RepID=A0A919JH48_9ACTN|nr:GAF and ANTAR domain-containing protein [Actinoplanes nipponensis]GIE49111.1 transcriptional regulator [Actinoplanes nipponensis]